MHLLYMLEANPPGSIIHFDQKFFVELGIQWFNTLLLTVILAWLVYNPVKKFMNSRSERIAKQIGDAQTAEQKAHLLQKEYENKLGGIETERTGILDTARKRAQERTDEILSQAKLEAKHIREHAAGEIALEQEKAKDEMKKEIVDLSLILAGRFTAVSLDRQAQDRLIEETFAGLEDVRWPG